MPLKNSALSVLRCHDSSAALICGGLSDDGMSGSSGAALLRLLPLMITFLQITCCAG